MVRISHKTYCSSPDKYGDCYQVYIDPTTSKSGSHVTWYTCQYTLRRETQFSIAKFSKMPGECTETWAENEVKVIEMASAVAKKFNHMIQSLSTSPSSCQIEFVELRMAKLDATAIFSRKRKFQDFYTFEPKLDNFNLFVDGHGLMTTKPGVVGLLLRRNSSRKRTISESSQTCVEVVRSSRSGSTTQTCSDPDQSFTSLDGVHPPPYCESPPSYEQSEIDLRTRLAGCHMERVRATCPDFEEISQHQESTTSNSVKNLFRNFHGHYHHELLNTFIHYFFTHTLGEIAICDLSGTHDKGCSYTLTAPTLHSLDGKYGAKDKGEAGIREVIQHHTCTQWCCHLADMTSLFEEAIERRRQRLYRNVATTRL